MRNLIKRYPALFFILFAFYLLSACVPSPTATPPRQTPFPTLPFLDGTETPGVPVGLGTPIVATSIPTFAPPTAVPIPTNESTSIDTLPPLVQLTVQDPELPVSSEQTVPLNVLAADNNIITRLEVYDNGIMFAQAPVVLPASVYLNQFTWKADVLGNHVLSAIAYDAHGNASEPAQIELAVINNNRAPSLQIVSPSGSKNAELGAPVLIQGIATDDVAVTRIELIVDNQLVTFAVPENPGGVTPFAVALPWTPTTTGSHNFVLRAI